MVSWVEGRSEVRFVTPISTDCYSSVAVREGSFEKIFKITMAFRSRINACYKCGNSE